MTTEGMVWLDACFMQKILRNANEDESIEVSGVTVKAATARGDNYMSDIHRVTVEFSRVRDGHAICEQTSLILKAEPENDLYQEMMKNTQFFETEISIMSKILPKMNEINKKLDSTSLGPICYYAQHEKPTHIIMEDLVPRGYRMADHQEGLDLEHSLLAIRNLGRFHAASVRLKEKDPQVLMNHKMGICHKDQSSIMPLYLNSGTKALAKETAKWPELSPGITKKLFKLSETLYEKGCEAALYQENEFNVLNHGDFWVNNMLFRYDEQRKPVEQVFVDFQMSFYGSPAVDLLFFIGTSPTDEVRLHHRELLLHEYHNSLSSTMSKLECDTEIPSFDKLQEALKKRAFYEVLSSVTTLGLVLMKDEEKLDVEEMMKPNGECTNAGYNGKLFRKIMTRLLPWYDSMGLLDG